MTILILAGMIPAVWIGLLIAPFLETGLVGRLGELGNALGHPFHITLNEDSFRGVLLMVAVYAVIAGILLAGDKNYRRREEYGSARWGSIPKLKKKYAPAGGEPGKILTEQVTMGMDGKRHRRNLNVMVVGGSGAGKTRYFARPNIALAQSSMVILDPKGELSRDTGSLLSAKGVIVKVLDLISMEKSHCYNPLYYLKSDNDIQRLVTNLFKNTSPKGSQSQDPFWDQAAMMLLLALIFYLHYEAPPEEQNFPMVMEMIRAGEVKENSDNYVSILDILFERLALRNPDHIALKYYRNYRAGSGKTLKSIQITLVSRLEKFNLESLAAITQTDELELDKMGERKTALFAVIPDNDSSFNFMVGMLYTQLFQQLYYQADVKHNGSLPVHVHFVMDEFANVNFVFGRFNMLRSCFDRSISKNGFCQQRE